LRGRLREAQQLAEASIGVMRRIDHRWGAARALLGLGDLARLRGDPVEARSSYLAALPILREIDSRPEIARCLAGLGRVALDRVTLDPGEAGVARAHFAESIRLSVSTGARIGVARGLEAFAALAIAEGRPERAVQLAAAATALREAAGLPPLSGARTERYLASARGLGEPVVRRLWAEGLALLGNVAVALALDGPRVSDGHAGPAGAAAGAAGAAVGAAAASTARRAAAGHQGAPPGMLTPREREIVSLVAAGRSNRAIAEELFISPATAARHVANIHAKLGFTSRTQIAAWAADKGLGLTSRAGDKRAQP
jgi:DNA-binding CsgD family transcriptional regulator